ncbi:hypothetical protein MLD38_037694 [Melastoma candidum]|uniref:Uncharacterized protein n=1 Tax=Melastoma candidum TaxID=119954 RepID=A0ACB9LQ58_9MYRT|nr:hypothetical protein MLD38_037694 [Melastoma candidum]
MSLFRLLDATAGLQPHDNLSHLLLTDPVRAAVLWHHTAVTNPRRLSSAFSAETTVPSSPTSGSTEGPRCFPDHSSLEQRATVRGNLLTTVTHNVVIASRNRPSIGQPPRVSNATRVSLKIRKL